MPDDRAKDLKWVEINDFRPGIISQAKYAYGANDNSAPVPFLGNPGAAQANGTVGCIALANGGLAPLPGLVKTVDSQFQPSTGTAVINGAIIHTLGASVEVVYGIEITPPNPIRQFQLTSYIDEAATTTAIVNYGPNTATGGEATPPLTGGLTRVNSSDPTLPGQPYVAISYTYYDDVTTTVANWLYPDAPGGFNVTSLSDNAYTGWMALHQNRIIIMGEIEYTWVGTVNGVVTSFGTSEVFNYTEPPNSAAMGNQDEVFVAEHPGQIGAWGSISAGEFFYVKGDGGGTVISGDFNTPTVTYLGGITPTFGCLNNIACQSIVGLVYASSGNGVWSWQGGQNSVKLSNNLNDDFYEVASPVGLQFSAAAFGDWIAMSNGWVYDITNGGWWKHSDPGFTPLYYGTAADGKGFWCVAAEFHNDTDPVIAQFSFSNPTNSFTWKSYPLIVPDQGRYNMNVSIQEVTVRAQGTGTILLTFEGAGDTTSLVQTVDVTETQPQMYRKKVGTGTGTFTAQDITLTIESTGTDGGPAPTIYSVHIGYMEMNPANMT